MHRWSASIAVTAPQMNVIPVPARNAEIEAIRGGTSVTSSPATHAFKEPIGRVDKDDAQGLALSVLIATQTG